MLRHLKLVLHFLYIALAVKIGERALFEVKVNSNYWMDTYFVVLSALIVLVQLLQWWFFAKASSMKQYTSAIELRKALEVARDSTLRTIWYSISLAPTENQLHKHSLAILGAEQKIETRVNADLLRMIWRVDLFLPLSILLIGFGAFYLIEGGIPSFAAFLTPAKNSIIPVMSFLMSCFVINGLSVIIFAIYLNKN